MGTTIIGTKRTMIQSEIENWLGDVYDHINEIAKINLIHNATMMVEDGLGYAILLDHLIKDVKESPICFRPLYPKFTTGCVIIWKKHKLLSSASSTFI